MCYHCIYFINYELQYVGKHPRFPIVTVDRTGCIVTSSRNPALSHRCTHCANIRQLDYTEQY